MGILTQFRWQLPLQVPRLIRTRSRHVPRAIVSMLGTFILANVLLGVGIQRDVVKVRDALYDRQFSEIKKYPAFWGPSEKVRIVAMGSSRTQQSFDPTILMKNGDVEAINFAIPGAGSMANAIYLRRLFQEGLKADLILIEWHPGFTAMPNKGFIFENGWLYDNRLQLNDFDLLWSWGNPRPKPNTYSLFWYLNTFQQFRLELINKYLPGMQVVPLVVVRDNDDRIRGHTPGLPYDPVKYEEGLQLNQKLYRFVFEDYHLGGPGWAALKDMVAVSREYGAIPIVIFSPESKDLQKFYGERANQELKDALSQFDCPVINARDWLPPEGTNDGHHATAHGARIYSENLALALKTYMKSPRTP